MPVPTEGERAVDAVELAFAHSNEIPFRPSATNHRHAPITSPSTLNGVHCAGLTHGSLAAEQIAICPAPQLVAHCDPVNPVPRLNPQVESNDVAPVAQHTSPASFPWQSSGSTQPHVIEPTTGHAAPAGWHDETDPSGASQHCWPARQWTAPSAVKGQ